MTHLNSAISLYEQDILLWAEETAARLKARDFDNLDIDNLVEEVEALGISQRKELTSRLIVLLDAVPSLSTRWDSSLDKAWQMALKNVRKEYPQADFPSEWLYSRSPAAMLDRDFWLDSSSDRPAK